MSGQQKCPCDVCTPQRTTRISPLGTITKAVAKTGHDRLIKQQQRANSRGKARKRGGRRG